jgi:hypothetical protein
MAAPSDTQDSPRGVSLAAVVATCAAIAAAWLAADSVGLLAEPLRIGLTWLALGAAIVVGFLAQKPPRWLALLVLLAACLPLVVHVPALHLLFLVAAVTGLLAAAASGPLRTAWTACAAAILTLAAFRLACASIPVLWVANDRAGAALGHLAGWIADRPLRVGATFAGTDFLLLMAALTVAWYLSAQRPRWYQAAGIAAAILAGHLLYLIVLAHAADLADLLPESEAPAFDHPYTPPDWRWSPAVAQLLPWNVPLLAAAIHLCIAAVLLRWTNWKPRLEEQPGAGGPIGNGSAMRRRQLLAAAPFLLALLVPVSATLSTSPSSLAGKRIVVNRQGRLNWDRPQFDRYGRQSGGLFGMLPLLVESLGGRLQQSDELSEADLAAADVLLLLHPVGPIAESVRMRVMEFVHRGGALLLVAEPYLQDGASYSAAGEFLQPAAVSVRRDVAISETGNWQQAIRMAAHPVAAGVQPGRSNYFTDAGSSLAVGWSTRPLVVGRWGWSDPGSDAVLTGSYELEPGERLGDLVLVAEQPFGQGTIVVLGDDHSLTNEGSVHGYTFTGRLLAYLANRPGSPLSPGRQLVTSLLIVGLLVLLAARPDPRRLVITALLLAASLAVCDAVNRRVTRVVPDGTLAAARGSASRGNLAYIDSSHLEAYSDAAWVFDGIEGLALTLMRNGYLTVAAPEVTSQRLEKAAIFVSVAPARRFSGAEQDALQQFVESGGILICTVGAEQARASAPLLAEFDVRVPPSPVPSTRPAREPEPIGRMRSLFLSARDYGAGDYRAGVLFHAAWPVEVRGGNADVLVRAADNRPIVVARRVGRGSVVVIGDTGFAMNKNLEYIGGEPFDGGYENAHFWRWLISRLTDRQEWVPPPPPPAQADQPLTPEERLPAQQDAPALDELPALQGLPLIGLPELNELPAESGQEDPS